MKNHRQLGFLTLACALQHLMLGAERVVLVAGGGEKVTGPATECRLKAPFGMDSDASGNLYIVEMDGGERVLKVDAKGMLTVVAGTGQKGKSGNGGSALLASFNNIHSLALGPGGDLFLADTANNCVRKIDTKAGNVYGFAGTMAKGFAGDGGPSFAAQFGGVYCVSCDPKGQAVYLTDLDNRRIRGVNLKTSMVKTVAGNGEKGVPVDGAQADKSPLVDPRAAVMDSHGNLYVLERGGNALRKVDHDGKISTVAGTGEAGASGDGGDALKATFRGPKHLCLDLNDNVIIADTDNHVIRKYLVRERRVVRLAGSGKRGTGGVGGPAKDLELDQPHGVYVSKAGVLYIADSLNNRVLKIEP